MANESEELISNFLKKIQENEKLRGVLAIVVLLTLAGSACYFLYDILPRQYTLQIAGGDVVSNRHYLTKALQAEAADNDVSLLIKPVDGTEQALQLLDQGKLDLAFIQAGLPNYYSNIVHVATIAPELLHFLVRRNIADVAGLKGKLIDLGSKNGELRVNAKQVLAFSGLTDGIDYVESNLGQEELMSMNPDKLPDAIVTASFVPSVMADFLIKQRGYSIIEIPFPVSLAARFGWAESSNIPAYMYGAVPAVPGKDIRTVGINLHLVAHKDVDPRAVFNVLDSLFSPSMELRMKMKMDENRLTIPSGYPLSEGAKKYMARRNPIISRENLEKAKAALGFALSIISALLVMLRWFKGERPGAGG